MVQVIVVGGGNGGITVAARLVRDNFDVTVIEPRTTHVYRPLLSFVGAGRASLQAALRPQQETIPDGCRWVRDRVASVAPERKSIECASGEQLSYDHLVVAPGMEADWSSCPGLAEVLHTDYASTNYITDLAPKTWRLVQALHAGTALFTLPAGPISNGGSALKALFMSCDYWHSQGRLDDIDVVFATATDTVFGVPEVDREAQAAIERYGIRVLTDTTVTEVSSANATASLRTGNGAGAADGQSTEVRFDFAHFVPPYRAPEWIATGELSDEDADGFVAVDPQTLQHRRWPTVWAVGDAAGTPNSKAGAAIRKQAPVLAANIAAVRAGGTPTKRYDGYSAAPITFSRDRLSLFEFDPRYRPLPTTRRPDLTKPRRLSWLFDRYGFPQIYWRRILRGKG